MDAPHDAKPPPPLDRHNSRGCASPTAAQPENAEAKLLFPTRQQWQDLASRDRLKAMARRAMAYISIHRDELSKRLVIGLTALAVIVMADSAGPAQREAADPMGRMIQTAHGDLSLKGLQRVSVSMSPYAQGMAERLTSLGPEWTPKGPEAGRAII
jgi:hypothetical protein